MLRAAIDPFSLSGKVLYELRAHYRLAISTPIRTEIEDVLSRPKLRAKFKTLTDERVTAALAQFDQAFLIELDDVPTVSRDPKDDIFLATARVAKAQYIVSEDKDLLVLDPYEGIRIVGVFDFMRFLQSRALPSSDLPEGYPLTHTTRNP